MRECGQKDDAKLMYLFTVHTQFNRYSWYHIQIDDHANNLQRKLEEKKEHSSKF